LSVRSLFRNYISFTVLAKDFVVYPQLQPIMPNRLSASSNAHLPRHEQLTTSPSTHSPSTILSSTSIAARTEFLLASTSLVTMISPISKPCYPVFVPPLIRLPSHSSSVASEDPALSWPTNLGEKILGDVLVATTFTALVSPFLTVVDKALVQRSNGSHTLGQSAWETCVAVAQRPGAYLKSPTYLWMWMTYASTYSAANMLHTVTEHYDYQRDSKTNDTLDQQSNGSYNENTAKTKCTAISSNTATIFVGTTMVNTTASLVKDRAYAKLFGNNSVKAVPNISYGLWMTRDFTVVGSSFILPEYVAAWASHHVEMEPSRVQALSQLGTPILAQTIAGPLHFLGLDCYNRPLSPQTPWNLRVLDRWRVLQQNVIGVVGARMARILPGYGIGGVYNKRWKAQWRDYLIQRQVERSRKEELSPASIRQLVALIRSKQQSS
jgi:hypothetical protein